MDFSHGTEPVPGQVNLAKQATQQSSANLLAKIEPTKRRISQ